MKKAFTVAAFLLLFTQFSNAQSVAVPFPTVNRDFNAISRWGNTTTGTNWDQSKFLPFIYKDMWFRLMPPNGVSYSVPNNTWTYTDPTKKYPLMLFFHGAGEAGTDNNNQLNHGGIQQRDAILSDKFPGFALYPQSVDYNKAVDLINKIIASYPIDINRIYVHGLSNGSVWLWNFMVNNPTLIAAAHPMSGVITASTSASLLYTPLRLAQGGLDTNPNPTWTQQIVDWYTANGGHLEYFYLPTLGHGTWDTMYARSDFFSWFLSHKKNEIQVLFSKNLICPGAPVSVKMGFTAGFDAYEWRKDGVQIAGATTSNITVTQFGLYTGRLKNRGVWTDWSDPVTVGVKTPTNTPPIQVSGLHSTVLPAPDGSTTSELLLPEGYQSYSWKNASNQVVSTTRVFTSVPVGTYTATANEFNGCTTNPSPAFKVLNSTGPNPPDAILDFLGYANSVSSVTLAWTDKPSPIYNETGFEIYRATNPAGPYALIAINAANVINYVDNGLTPNTVYSYKIRPVNQFSAGPVSAVISVLTQVDATAPTTPSNLTASAIQATQVDLSWGASTDNVGIFKYDIYKDGVRVLSTASSPATIYNLTPGQVYKFSVKARDFTGNSSLESNLVMVPAVLSGLAFKYYEATTFGPNLPDFNTLTPVETGITPNIDLTVRNRTTQYAFLWQGMINIPVAGDYIFGTNSDDGSNLYIGGYGDAYKVVDNNGSHTSRDREGTKNFSAPGLYPIYIAYYQATSSAAMTIFWRNTAAGQVSKVNIPNSAFSPVTPLGGSAPAAPSNLAATTASFDKINLTWTDNSSNETGFRVYRATNNNGPWANVASVAANATSFQDQALAGATKYYYRITAVGDFGESGASTGVPRGLAYNYYEAASMTSLSLLPSLTPIKSGASSFFDIALRDRNENMALSWVGQINITTAATYTFFTSSDDGSTLSIDGAQVVSNDFNQNQTERSGTKALTVGWHDIQVQWRKRTSSNSRLTVSYQRTGMSKTAITSSNANALFFGTEINATTTAVPPAPLVATNLVATSPTPTSISLTWTDNATDETSYQVLRSYQTNTSYIVYKTLPAGSTSYLDQGLFANATYYYKVKVIGPGGSATTPEVSKTTSNNPPALTALHDIAVKFGKVLDLDIISQDADGDPITLSVTGLPAFGTFADHTDGTGALHFTPASNQLGDYPITVTARDNHAGVATTSFVLTVTDKESPVFVPITDASLAENQSGSMLIQASVTPGPGNITFSFVGLPSFASYVVNGGLVTITLTPGYTDSGNYPVSVTASDPVAGSTTKSFQITVSDVNPNIKTYVNIVSSTSAAAPWNNVTGLSASAFKDGNGATTSVGLQFQTGTWLTYTAGAVTGNNSGVFPDNVIQDYYYFGFNGGPPTVDVKVTGLNVSQNYNFAFLGSSAFVGGGITDNGTTLYTINGQTVALDVQNNSSNLAKLNHITPNPDGTVTFTMSMAADGTPVGYLNAFTIEALYQDGTAPAAPRNATAVFATNAVNVSWVDAPFNEEGFDVYRSASAGGPFTKINASPIAANSTSYSDNTIVNGATYYYQVTASNSFGVSPASNTAAVSLSNVPPPVNVSGNVVIYPNVSSQITVSTSADATIAVTNLPSFATLTPVNAYTVNITFVPATSNIGSYQLQATATSGSLVANQPIAITVSESVLYKVYVNFNQGVSAPAPWNNTAKIPAANDVFSNLKNDSNVGSGVSLTLQTAFGGVYNEGAQTGNNSGIVPDAVLKEYYWFGVFGNPNDMYMRVSGLSATNKYRFKFVSSSTFTNNGQITNNGSTVFSIGAQTASVNVQANTSQFAVIQNVVTDSQGGVVIHVSKGANTLVGYLNAMIIEALPIDPSAFVPTGLKASGYSKTQVNLTWSDNSPVETGYEIQRSETGVDASYGAITTTAADITSYVDVVPVSNKIYYYRVRAIQPDGPSAFTNVAKSSAVAFKILINLAGNATYDTPAPWNNTSRFGLTGDIFVGFKDDTGAGTGLRMRVQTQVESANDWGMTTNNNSGVFPDKVLKSFWFNDAFFPVGEFVIDGLDQTFSYNFGFMGSIDNPNPVSTDFSINGTTVSNKNNSNISNVSYIRNVKPDGNSEILFTVKETAGSAWSIWNALVIEGYATGGNAGARTSRNALVSGNLREVRYGLAAENTKIYPNPVNAEMHIAIEDSSIGEIGFQFYDMMGKEVQRGSFNNDLINTEFSVGVDLTPALYLVKLTYPDGKVETKRFVKN